MSKRDPLSQAQKLDGQIKKMQEKQKRYIEKAEKEIGNYLMETWDIEDIQQAKEVIDYLKEYADNYFEKDTKVNDSDHQALNNENG